MTQTKKQEEEVKKAMEQEPTKIYRRDNYPFSIRGGKENFKESINNSYSLKNIK